MNPLSQKNAGAWKATTYNVISGVTYLVDTGSASVSFIPSAGTLSKFQDITVTPLMQTSLDTSTYTFFIKLQQSIPLQGQLIITIPIEISVASSAIIRSSCLYHTPITGIQIPMACSVSGSTITMPIPVAHNKANTLKVEMRGLKNPRTQ